MAYSSNKQEIMLVSEFAEAMLSALERNRESKVVWTEISTEDLIDGLQKNYEKLVDTFIAHNPNEIKKRCVNIANFAAMIAERYSK